MVATCVCVCVCVASLPMTIGWWWNINLRYMFDRTQWTTDYNIISSSWITPWSIIHIGHIDYFHYSKDQPIHTNSLDHWSSKLGLYMVYDATYPYSMFWCLLRLQWKGGGFLKHSNNQGNLSNVAIIIVIYLWLG